MSPKNSDNIQLQSNLSIFKKEIFIEGNVLRVLQAGIHVKGGADGQKNTLLTNVLTWGSDPSESDGLLFTAFFSPDSSNLYYFFKK